MSDRFVTIRHVSDPVEAEMLRDLLEQEGIPATIQGANHSAMLGGLMASALNVPLQVPEAEAERARAILDALTDFEPEGGAEQELPPERAQVSEGPYRTPAASEAMPPRRARLAVAAAIVLPMVLGIFGAGHFYVRSYLRGVALLLLAWTGIVIAMRGHAEGLALAPLAVVLDAVGAAMLARAQE